MIIAIIWTATTYCLHAMLWLGLPLYGSAWAARSCFGLISPVNNSDRDFLLHFVLL